MPEEGIKDVMLRLERLEAKVGAVKAAPKTSKLSSAEIDAYHKVVTALWEDGTCGINETSPCVFKCNVVSGGKLIPIPRKCDVECTCGPCNVYGPVFGGAWRFGGLG